MANPHLSVRSQSSVYIILYLLLFFSPAFSWALMGGQPVDRRDYKKIPVMLVLHTEDELEGFYPCSATMLNPRTFLTAAHCVQNERVYIQRTTDLQREVRRHRKGH